MEKLLNKQRVSDAKKRRCHDPNVIFKDLQAESQLPCQTLLLTKKSTVVEVCVEENALVIQPDNHWDPDSPLKTTLGNVDIIHAEADKVWVSTVHPDMAGTSLIQEKLVANITDMFEEFRKEWMQRWDKHHNTPDEFWDPIVDFACQACPTPPPMRYAPITYDEWIASLKKKSKRAATGPDGTSRDDLLRLPKHLTMQLLRILEEIERDGNAWPVQLVQAFVIALAKTESASQVNDYRPISIFPVAYRNWSSIRARQLIAHLSSLVPETLAGSVPHKSAHSVWYAILADLEMAHHTDQELAGAVIDLVKCFNLLPRFPILKILKHFQVAPEILRAWSSALVHMRRRFKLRNCVGPPIPSTTGFAEGCGLSVCAMLAVNLVAHRWMSIKHATTQLWSFVDNLELTCPGARAAKISLDALMQFTQVMDVKVDLSKTYVWSTKTEGRRELREDEDQEFQAWPLALHGIQGVTLGEHHFNQMRTGAARGASETGSEYDISPTSPRTDGDFDMLKPHTFCAAESMQRQCSNSIGGLMNNEAVRRSRFLTTEFSGTLSSGRGSSARSSSAGQVTLQGCNGSAIMARTEILQFAIEKSPYLDR
eukprot:s2103_g4.t1